METTKWTSRIFQKMHGLFIGITSHWASQNILINVAWGRRVVLRTQDRMQAVLLPPASLHTSKSRSGLKLDKYIF